MLAFTDLARTCDTMPTIPLLIAATNAQCPDDTSATAPPPPPSDSIAGFGAYLDDHLDCSLAELKRAARAVDYACCVDDACAGEDGDQGFAPADCSPDCGGKMLVLYDTCSQTLDTGGHCSL